MQVEATFRRVNERDYPSLLQLQEANLRDNLTPEQSAQGFLSARFTRDQFAAMDADVAVVVARLDGAIKGYLCGSSVECNRQFPLLAAMLEQYPRVALNGRVLSDYASFVYGPVCVDRNLRGRGLLRGLFDALSYEVKGKFEAGVAFVAQDNTHSLAAHVHGLGMSDVGGFEFGGRAYRIVAFTL